MTDSSGSRWYFPTFEGLYDAKHVKQMGMAIWLYGWVLAHYAVRWLMHQAATEHRQPDRSLSFAANVQLLRCAQPQSGVFPPSAAKKASMVV